MRALLLIATTVALTAPVLPAQSRLLATNGGSTRALIPVDPSRVAEALARAEEAWQAGKNREARKIYQSLIAEQVAADEFAGAAMWRLALNYLYNDEKQRAAETLDELAEAASRYGDPAMQLRSTFESAVLWSQLKRPALSNERLLKAKALLQSPAIPVAEKESIKGRIK